MNGDEWIPIPMYCPNCGKLNYGSMDKDKKILYECRYCQATFLRIRKSRRHERIEVYMEHLMG